MIAKALENLKPDAFHDLIMEYKYCETVKRVARGITHDYNNIFSGLSGQLTIFLQQYGLKDFSIERRDLIHELIQRGTHQTEILFDFSRDQKRIKKQHSPLQLVSKAVELLNSISQTHHFKLVCQNELPKISAKARDIILMLFYLGENAIEAMKNGGDIHLQLTHGIDDNGTNKVEFKIIDNGCGFTEEMKKNAVMPFSTTKVDQDIVGLGLYAAYSIVNDHHGGLKITTREEGGSIITVELPSERKELFEIKAHNPKMKYQNSARTKGKSVFLIVDDEESMRSMLLNRLQRKGHIVFCAESCKEALEEFSQLSDMISAILLDVGLRDGTGYECAKKLQKINKRIKIIFMSGQACDHNEQKGSNRFFLKKPFSIEQVEEIINYGEI